VTALKTVKQEEPVARSRFVDCPVCKDHTLKLKRTVQIGRCKNCKETYKVIMVFIKKGRKSKTASLSTDAQPAAKQENKTKAIPESSLPSWQQPSDTSLFGSTSEPYSGLSEAVFGKTDKQESSEAGSGSGQ
jgi:ribosomal protein L37AE/L43A